MKKNILLLIFSVCCITTYGQSWSITGNAGTTSANFIGTTDRQPLRFKIFNGPAGLIDSLSGVTALGWNASLFAGNGYQSVAIGFRSCASQAGYQNVAVGAFTLPLLTTGSANVALGAYALYSTTSGLSNTAVGYSALYNSYGGVGNVAMGVDVLRSNSTGSYNVAVGNSAMISNNGSLGSYNTAIGVSALQSTTNSQYNTAIGYRAGTSYDLGYNNTILGANCGGSFSGQYNIIAIGQGVTCPNNSTARIGNSATWSIGGYAGWSNFSDGRFKKDIKEDVKGLDFIMKLRPVTYRLDIGGLSKQLKENNGEEWNPQMRTAIAEKEKMIFTGFVAQEVEKAATETGFDFNGVDKPTNKEGFYALRYAEFVVPLVKAMQEQQQVIEEMKKQNADLLKRLTELEKRTANCIITTVSR